MKKNIECSSPKAFEHEVQKPSKKNNLQIYKEKKFPDHYNFSKTEIQKIIDDAEKNNCQIIMTEKDYFKMNINEFKKIDYLRVAIEIDNKQKLLDKTNTYYVKNN